MVLCVRMILQDLGYSERSPTVLYVDNQATINIVNDNCPTPRARHVDVQHFAIQEWRERGDIKLSHIPGVINPADAETKALSSILHRRHVQRAMGHYNTPHLQ